jgi:hypothetical protein
MLLAEAIEAEFDLVTVTYEAPKTVKLTAAELAEEAFWRSR